MEENKIESPTNDIPKLGIPDVLPKKKKSNKSGAQYREEKKEKVARDERRKKRVDSLNGYVDSFHTSLDEKGYEDYKLGQLETELAIPALEKLAEDMAFEEKISPATALTLASVVYGLRCLVVYFKKDKTHDERDANTKTGGNTDTKTGGNTDTPSNAVD